MGAAGFAVSADGARIGLLFDTDVSMRSVLSNRDQECVDPIDSVCEEHPGDEGAEKAEDDAVSGARALV